MSAIAELPPAVILLVAAITLPLWPKAMRPFVTVLAPLLGLVHLTGLPEGAFGMVSFAGFDLVVLAVDRTNFLFGTIFLLIGAVAGIYAWHVRDLGQQVSSQLYAAGALGVTFAGDFLTLLIFWELMAVASAWLVFARRRPESTAAGFRYLLVHLAGGTALLAGILLHYGATGSLLLGPLDAGGGIAPWLVLLGVALNAAIPPLHPWLPDAYPKATVTGAIFMSALTTKSAVYVLMKLFAGWDILVGAGVIMTLYGVVYAVLANDIRQILAYHIVSQVGFMVTGVGLGTQMALNGTAAHAYSHILYKALLFMGAGAVIEATGRSKLTELGGLGRHMRATMWLFLIGAFSISGFPLFNGFISKSIIVSAAGDAERLGVMLLLLLASVGTFLSIALKIPVFAFGGAQRGPHPQPIPTNMYVAMVILALLCFGYGVAPGMLYVMLPYAVDYHPYTAYHLVEAGQMLVFAFVGFWVVRDKLAGSAAIALDTDWFYRRGGRVLSAMVVEPVNAFFNGGVRLRDAVVEMAVAAWRNPRRWFEPWREDTGPFEAGRERSLLGASVGFVLGFLVFFSLLALWW